MWANDLRRWPRWGLRKSTAPDGTWSPKGSRHRRRRRMHGARRPRSSLRGLLLGHAVERAEAPHEVQAVDADDLALRKQLRDDAERDTIGRIVERRHDDASVGDVEVGVARGQALAVEDHGAGHRQIDDL